MSKVSPKQRLETLKGWISFNKSVRIQKRKPKKHRRNK
jgi:hypothetical protein